MRYISFVAVSPVSNSAEIGSALNDLVSKFCKTSKTTITDIKHRHLKEFNKLTKHVKEHENQT